MIRDYTIRIVLDSNQARRDLIQFRQELADTERQADDLRRKLNDATTAFNSMGTAARSAANQVNATGNAMNRAGVQASGGTTHIAGLGKAMLGLGIADAVMDRILEGMTQVSQEVRARIKEIEEAGDELARLRGEAEELAKLRGERGTPTALVREAGQLASNAGIDRADAMAMLEQFERTEKAGGAGGGIDRGSEDEELLLTEAATMGRLRNIDRGVMGQLVGTLDSADDRAGSKEEVLGRARAIANEADIREVDTEEFVKAAMKATETAQAAGSGATFRQMAADISARMEGGLDLAAASKGAAGARSALAGNGEARQRALAMLGIDRDASFDDQMGQAQQAIGRMADPAGQLREMGFGEEEIAGLRRGASAEARAAAASRLFIGNRGDAEIMGGVVMEQGDRFRLGDADAQRARVEGQIENRELQVGDKFDVLNVGRQRAERALQEEGAIDTWWTGMGAFLGGSMLRENWLGDDSDRQRNIEAEAWQQLQMAEVKAGIRQPDQIQQRDEIDTALRTMDREVRAQAYENRIGAVSDRGVDPFPEDLEAGFGFELPPRFNEQNPAGTGPGRSRRQSRQLLLSPDRDEAEQRNGGSGGFGGLLGDALGLGDQASVKLDDIAGLLGEQVAVNRQMLDRMEARGSTSGPVERTRT